MALAVTVAVTPDPPHGKSRAGDHADEAELLVAGPPVPEVEAESSDDQKRGPVEHEALARGPALDLPASLAPEDVDEESDRQEEGDSKQHPDRRQRGVEVENHDDERDQPDDEETS